MVLYDVDDSPDPLAVVTAPPPNETPTEKAAREEREAEAQRISDQIDDELRSERVAFKKQERMVKILLLGQSGSGKSTVIKHFRMRFARDKWVQERPAWRTVLQLNLAQSVNKILATLQDALDDSVEDPLPFSNKHNLLRLRLRLLPLTGVEGDLKQLLAHKMIKHDGVNSQDVTKVIASRKNDIIQLCGDHVLRKTLQREKVHLEDSFFLDNAERLADRDYDPTDNDIIHARLHTLNIEEYELDVAGDGVSPMWKIYDFGGSRTQRHAWLPYFDQMNAIVFLAPISCFDERLQEDPRVNRLEDSFILWKAICSSKLLSKTNLVIFLNKIDILTKKIANGVMVKRYLACYGDRPNDTDSVVNYLRHKFKDTVKQNSPEPRTCHIYSTSAIDARTTTQVMGAVHDEILRAHLRNANISIL